MCTPECQAAQAKYQQDNAAWHQRWPNACDTCHAQGGTYSCYDPSPAGVSLSAGCMTDYDPCPKCSEKHICPRCAAPCLPEEEGMCPVCGWNWGKNQDDSPPMWPECMCWLEEMNQAEAEWLAQN